MGSCIGKIHNTKVRAQMTLSKSCSQVIHNLLLIFIISIFGGKDAHSGICRGGTRVRLCPRVKAVPRPILEKCIPLAYRQSQLLLEAAI